jgi:NAD(P)-dependent dehydrogenase (short-subunit alcohol dehydrogenase family)
MAGGLAAAGAALAAASANSHAQTQSPARSAGERANPQGRFKDKVVLITGATSGIGMVTAHEFAKEGAKVFFCGRREGHGRRVEAAIRAFGGDATFMPADVREPRQVKAFVDAAVARYGRIDIAFNNAGVGAMPSPAKDLDVAVLEDLWRTNVAGKVYAAKYEAEHMEKQGGGVIINTGSIFGVKATENSIPYVSSQFGVSGLTKSLALELGPKNIRVVAVAPGAVKDTDLGRFVPGGWKLDAAGEKEFGARHSVNRMGTPMDIARVVLFLASDDASFVHGDVMPVDGYFLRG